MNALWASNAQTAPSLIVLRGKGVYMFLFVVYKVSKDNAFLG